MDETEFQLDNQLHEKTKRVAAETCFNIAVQNLQNGNQEEAKLYFRWAESLLDRIEHFQTKKDTSESSAFRSIDDLPFECFADFLRWKNIPVPEDLDYEVNGSFFSSGRKKNQYNDENSARIRLFTAEHGLRKDEDEADIERDLTGSNLKNRKPTSLRSEKFVKYVYEDPRSNGMETLGSCFFESENKYDNWNINHSQYSSLETEQSFISPLNKARMDITDSARIFICDLLDSSKAFFKKAAAQSVIYTKAAYQKFKSFSSAVLWNLLQILLIALCFVYLIIAFAVKLTWTVLQLVVKVVLILVLYFLNRLIGGDSKRTKYSSRRRRRRRRRQEPYVAKKELPKTSKEAVRHLLECKDTETLYEVLLVDEVAPQEEIKENYKRLVRLFHPDKHLENSRDAENATKILNAAYDVLGDQPKREQYDNNQNNVLSEEFAEESPSPVQNSIQCSVCGGRHAVTMTKRSPMNGRYCGDCNEYHCANAGEAWIESSLWTKELYLCLRDDFHGTQIYKLNTWSNCQSVQFDALPVSSHKVFIRMGRESQQQHDSKGKRLSGKKRRSRKYKL